jgi:hypothetical protein
MALSRSATLTARLATPVTVTDGPIRWNLDLTRVSP